MHSQALTTCKSLIVSEVYLTGTQLGTQNNRKQLHIGQHDTNSTIEGGGGRPGRRPSSSYMDKSVWKIFAKGAVAEAANGFLGFTLAQRTTGDRSSNLR